MHIQMRSFLLTTLSIFAFTAAIVFTSCKEEKCKSIVCAYDGTCNEEDGSCACINGYEGERCETATRDKFKGVWSVTEDGTLSNPAFYAVSVENGTNIDEVMIRNINNKSNAEIVAKVKADTIYIANQEFIAADGTYSIEGKGSIVPESFYGANGKLILKYKITSSEGEVNYYGMGGSNNPSIWTK